MELGLNFMRAGNFTEARQRLDECKVYSSYAMEAIVHFRIHTAIRTMSLISKQQKRQQRELEAAAAVGEDNVDAAGSGFGSSIWGALSRRWTGAEKSVECTEVSREETQKETAELL